MFKKFEEKPFSTIIYSLMTSIIIDINSEQWKIITNRMKTLEGEESIKLD